MATRTSGIAPPSFRLPDGAHVGRVRLQISDRSQSVAYYRDVLGFHPREGTDTTLVVQDGRELLALHERPGARAVPQAGVLGLFHVAILLPDRPSLGRFLRHIVALGVQFGAADHLVSEAVYLWDPDGLGIEVYVDRPRDQWQVRDGQLAMATDPLDFDSLAASAGGAEWTGMPAGTTIGHMHLQVGDLDRARAFYHAALGLDLTVWSYPGALFLSAGGYHHHLGVNTWARRARPADELDAQLLEWELVLPGAEDVASAARSLRDAGHTVTHAPDAIATDPWGTRVRLSADR
jgi:catechol 2,3-dioxygenase